jgi:hypothetical protein
LKKYGTLCSYKARETNSKRFAKLHAEGKMKYNNFLGKHHTEESKNKVRKTRIERNLNSKENNSSYGKP